MNLKRSFKAKRNSIDFIESEMFAEMLLLPPNPVCD